MEKTHTEFLKQIMEKSHGTWVTPSVELVWEAAVTKSEMTYTGRRKGMAAQWVVLRTTFEVCKRGKGYEWGRRCIVESRSGEDTD